MSTIRFSLQGKASNRGGVFANQRRLSALRSADRYPNTAKAVKKAAEEARSILLKAVQGKLVTWSGGTFKVNRVTGALAGSILGGLRYPYEGNKLAAAIVINHKHYKLVRDGIKSFDMKPGLLASAKAKISSKGLRYIVIPIPVDPSHSFSARVFRICSSNSKGWIHPGTAPRRLDLYVAEKMRERTRRLLRDALKKDLRSQ